MKIPSRIALFASVALLGVLYANTIPSTPSIRTFNSNTTYNPNPPAGVPIAVRQIAPIVSYNSNSQTESWWVSDLNDVGSAVVNKGVTEGNTYRDLPHYWSVSNPSILTEIKPPAAFSDYLSVNGLDNQNRVAGWSRNGAPELTPRVVTWSPGMERAIIPSVQNLFFNQAGYIDAVNRSGMTAGRVFGTNQQTFRWTIGQSAVQVLTFPTNPPNAFWQIHRINSSGQFAGIVTTGVEGSYSYQAFINDGSSTRLVGPIAQNSATESAFLSLELSDNGALAIRKSVSKQGGSFFPVRSENWVVSPGQTTGLMLQGMDHPAENPYSNYLGWPKISRFGQVVWSSSVQANPPNGLWAATVSYFDPAANQINIFKLDADDAGEVLTDSGNLFFSSKVWIAGIPHLNFWNPQLGSAGPSLVKVELPGTKFMYFFRSNRSGQMVGSYSLRENNVLGLFAPVFRSSPAPATPPPAASSPAPSGPNPAVIAAEIKRLNEQLDKDRKIKNPRARARAMSGTNLKLRMLSEGIDPNSPRGLLMVQLDNAKRLPAGPQKAKTIARLQKQLADLEKGL